MNKIEYKAMKKTAFRELGADDKESLDYYAAKIEKFAKVYKWAAIGLFIISIPLSFLIIGIPMLIGSIFIYFFAHKKMLKKVQSFREHLKNDPELASS
jgi:uncharacterized membrane protein YukC